MIRERGLRLATGLEAFWVVRDPVEGASWLERLLAAAPDADPELRGRALRALGGALDIVGEHERAATCYRESLELFTAAGDEVEAAHIRFRIAANMVMRGETGRRLAVARGCAPRVPDCVATGSASARRSDSSLRGRREGDLRARFELTLESAAIAREVGWAWWEAGQLGAPPTLERERGNLDAAERHALRALELGLGLGDRSNQRLRRRRARDHRRRARRRLGAGRAPLGCSRERGERRTRRPVGDRMPASSKRSVLRVDGPDFQQARAEGSLLSIAAGRRPRARPSRCRAAPAPPTPSGRSSGSRRGSSRSRCPRR